MLVPSRDILNLVLSVCLLALTFFLCWGIYYFIASIQKIYKLINRIEAGVSKVEEILEIAREKLRNSPAYFMILGEIAKKAMAFVQEKREKKEKKETRKKVN